jgi:hypothetical protein
VAAVALTLALGLGIGALSSFGKGADRDLYLAGAGTAALVALALFVDLALVLGALFDRQGDTPANRLTAQIFLRTNAALFVLAEGTSLYALGARRSSTLLVFCLGVPMVLQLVLLVELAYQRIGLARVREG